MTSENGTGELYKPGDTVRLSIGGPDCAVIEVMPGRNYRVVWLTKDHVLQGAILPEAMIHRLQ